jgi:hypothetical protein
LQWTNGILPLVQQQLLLYQNEPLAPFLFFTAGLTLITTPEIIVMKSNQHNKKIPGA